MKNLTIEEIRTKYEYIEDKIPSVFPDYKTAAIELAQDIYCHWNIQDCELIRVISLINYRTMFIKPRINLLGHTDNKFAFCGLYPEVMRSFDIKPTSKKEMLEQIFKKRNENKKS